jgi:hypothetical protein
MGVYLFVHVVGGGTTTWRSPASEIGPGFPGMNSDDPFRYLGFHGGAKQMLPGRRRR